MGTTKNLGTAATGPTSDILIERLDVRVACVVPTWCEAASPEPRGRSRK
jgi:hypothetical protein